MIPLLSTFFSQEAKGIVEIVGDIADDLITTDEEKQAQFLKQYELETQRLLVEQQGVKGQLDINKEEAKHPSMFVAGWRPATGWVCLGGFAYSFLIYQFILWGVAIWAPEIKPPPPVEVAPLMALLAALLGVGGLRTAEKWKGVARDRLRPPKGKE